MGHDQGQSLVVWGLDVEKVNAESVELGAELGQLI